MKNNEKTESKGVLDNAVEVIKTYKILNIKNKIKKLKENVKILMEEIDWLAMQYEQKIALLEKKIREKTKFSLN